MAVTGLSIGTLVCALGFGVSSPLIGYLRGTPTPASATKFVLDGLRGAGIVPLGAIIVLPLMDSENIVKVIEENFVIIAVSCIGAMWVVVQDWWNSM